MRITLPSGTPAELARPSGHAVGGLVVAPDIGGLRPLFDDLCARLATEQDWSVCAIEPWPGRQDLDLPARLEQVGTIDDTRIMGDLVAAADATNCDRVGLIGFCMGGMYALKGAGTGRFDRTVSFYGMIHVPEQWGSDVQGDPVAALGNGDATSVMAIIGERDPWTPPDDVVDLEALGVTVARYPDAEHGFVHDPDRPAHRADDAADAWRRAIAFLTT